MPKIVTLKKRSDFTRITARCRKHVTPAFILQIADNPSPQEGIIRIGYTASRKVGGAVQRNRAKRRLRELARQIFPELADYAQDYVLIARYSATSRDYATMGEELKTVLQRGKPGKS